MIATGHKHAALRDRSDSAHLVLALDKALSMFDDGVKQTIYYHMKQRGVSINADTADQKLIESALRDLLSDGAEIILRAMRREMQNIISLL